MEPKSQPEVTGNEKFVLQLYITGMSENSMRAILNIKQFCDLYLKNHFDLEIIDIYKDPSVAGEQMIVFSPSLIRQFPLPKKILIGDLSDTEKIFLGLGITPKE